MIQIYYRNVLNITKGIDIAVKKLEKEYFGLKISTATAMLGFSIPTYVTELGAVVGVPE